ncbi:hypothetical protein EQG41_00260 [Billgrantia azerbaijanica]|nr:hypothetical protein EQG41_00260 [Halomonas azerbaijanica]
MTTEPQRLQYLEAMGLTAWVARYRLPNARESEACDWALPEPTPTAPPGQRLHALLDEAEQAARQKASAARRDAADDTAGSAATSARPPTVGRARGLLDSPPPESIAPAPAAEATAGEASEPLRFAVQVACLDGRWLVLLPGRQPPSAVEVRLLGNLLRAAGITLRHSPSFQAFTWPLEEGLPVESPTEEAKAGLQAFIEGAGRRGWAPERVLLFGRDEILEPLLGWHDARCTLLDLPGWQGPALGELAGSAAAKRDLWPRLAGWRDAWFAAVAHGDGQGADD